MAVRTKRLTLAALFTALGILLPLAFHLTGIPAAGQIFLPMHIPVLLCGLILGPVYGAVCGAICPVAGFLLMNMPAADRVLFMTAELCAYGLAAGLFYRKCGLDRLRFGVYPALLGSMLSGRAVYALALTAAATLFGLENLSAHMAVQAAVTGLSGIAVQIVVLPPLVKLFEKSTFAHQLGLRTDKNALLREAKKLLQSEGCTLAVVFAGGGRFTSDGKGVRPLLECIDRYGAALRGAAVADRVTGRAAALLYAWNPNRGRHARAPYRQPDRRRALPDGNLSTRHLRPCRSAESHRTQAGRADRTKRIKQIRCYVPGRRSSLTGLTYCGHYPFLRRCPQKQKKTWSVDTDMEAGAFRIRYAYPASAIRAGFTLLLIQIRRTTACTSAQ